MYGMTTYAYIEPTDGCLVHNKLAHASIVNYISGLRSMFRLCQIDTHCLDHQWVSMVLKSIARNVPIPRKVKGVLSIQDLLNVVQVCDTMTNRIVYKAVFLVAFFSIIGYLFLL